MKLHSKIILAIFIFLSAFIIFEACMPGTGSSSQSGIIAAIFDNGPKEAQIIAPQSLTIEGDDSLYLGKSKTYKAVFAPSNTSDQRVSWSLSDSSVCSFDSGTATLKALKEGSVVLSAVSNASSAIKASKKITISQMALTSLSISLKSSKTSIVNGMTDKISFESDKDDLKASDLSFSSSDTSVVSVDGEGYIYTHKTGTAEITAESLVFGIKSNALPLEVISGPFTPVSSLSYQGEKSIYVGEKLSYSALFNSGASDTSFAYLSDESYLKADSSSITGVQAGETKLTLISISDRSLQAEVTIEIKEVKAKAITIEDLSLQYGKSTKLAYDLIPEKSGLAVTNKKLTFSSSDSSLASIDQNGIVLGYKKGKVDITLKWAEDESVSAVKTIIITSLDEAGFSKLHTFVRKALGHFSLFSVTGIFGMLVADQIIFKKKKIWASAVANLLYGFCLAGISELCQLLTPGRGPSFIDVMIDTGGYALSILIVSLILYLIWRKKKAENPPQPS